ncbi:MAG: methionine--tRNA ligase [Candidatus Saccharibacteria bacterium]|nr:methionine--tRNA ligase [Candidatus Saccharibacteria bacterium]
MKLKSYITTAIPYVNAKPHIGNAMDYLIADIWARYQRKLDKQVVFQVGTDEHGNKIAKKAQENGLSAQAYVDQNVGFFKELITKMQITNTDFVRTTDVRHMAAVQYIWKQLTPYIYKKSYEGWYCSGCEAFVTDKEAADNNGVCPDHKIAYQRLQEENYFLRVSKFTEKIHEAITSGKMRILPEKRAKEFLNLIKDGLEDVSISRPKKTVSWGVPVPDDPTQVMYVWIDALANYLTVIGYPEKTEWKEIWPADVQVVGKDILRFHAGIWPAMLMMLDLPLPKILLVHGHVQVSGVKMSKSVGNVVDPIELIDDYGVDAVRYYFSRHIPTQDDGDFTWERFEAAYNNELGNDLGNLVGRIASMIQKYQAGVVGEITAAHHDETVYFEAMRELKFNEALDEIWANVRALNQYIDTVKPWAVAKERESDPEADKHLTEILDYLTRSIWHVSELLEPFMPETSTKMQQIFKPGAMGEEAKQPLFPKIYLHTEDPRGKYASR